MYSRERQKPLIQVELADHLQSSSPRYSPYSSSQGSDCLRESSASLAALGRQSISDRWCCSFLPSSYSASESHRHCDKVQDAYTMRCVPQVHGIVLGERLSDSIKYASMYKVIAIVRSSTPVFSGLYGGGRGSRNLRWQPSPSPMRFGQVRVLNHKEDLYEKCFATINMRIRGRLGQCRPKIPEKLKLMPCLKPKLKTKQYRCCSPA
jgi:hypothetical protein